MKITYTVNTSTCPVCGKTLKSESDLWLTILFLAYLPISISITIAYFIINSILGGIEIPKVKDPIICPHCKTILKEKDCYELNELSKLQALIYKSRHLLRLCYFLGGIAILCFVALIIFLFNFDVSYLILIPIILISLIIITIIIIIFKGKIDSEKSKTINLKNVNRT